MGKRSIGTADNLADDLQSWETTRYIHSVCSRAYVALNGALEKSTLDDILWQTLQSRFYFCWSITFLPSHKRFFGVGCMCALVKVQSETSIVFSINHRMEKGAALIRPFLTWPENASDTTSQSASDMARWVDESAREVLGFSDFSCPFPFLVGTRQFHFFLRRSFCPVYCPVFGMFVFFFSAPNRRPASFLFCVSQRPVASWWHHFWKKSHFVMFVTNLRQSTSR